MHEEIRKFTLSGQIGDSDFIQTRERLEKFLEDSMRDEGCVPSIDLEPQFQRSYRPDTQTYDFELTVYGVEVGEELAWQVSGVSNGKRMMRSTVPTK